MLLALYKFNPSCVPIQIKPLLSWNIGSDLVA